MKVNDSSAADKVGIDCALDYEYRLLHHVTRCEPLSLLHSALHASPTADSFNSVLFENMRSFRLRFGREQDHFKTILGQCGVNLKLARPTRI